MIKSISKSLLNIAERKTSSLLSGDKGIGKVFVLGPPRSGTTLLYQTMVHCMKWSYFCSPAESRQQWPVLTTLLAKRKVGQYHSNFTSTHGFTENNAGPAEARDIWASWLGWEQSDNLLEQHQLEAMTSTVNAISNILQAPFVSKSPDHCLHIPKLKQAFPDALYIRVVRDNLETARSILHARQKLGTDWFGVTPPGWKETKNQHIVDQIFFQIDTLNKMVEDDFSQHIDPAKTITVDYSLFCQNTPSTMASIFEFLAANNIDVQKRHSIPDNFTQSAGKTFSEELEVKLLNGSQCVAATT